VQFGSRYRAGIFPTDWQASRFADRSRAQKAAI
jgi:hypothetical protein